MVTAALSFKTPGQLQKWLKVNHQTKQELWVRIFKKDAAVATGTWDDCVVAAIGWGWIDGQRKALDEVSYLIRLTPRRPRSSWSRRTCQHAERLMAQGLI